MKIGKLAVFQAEDQVRLLQGDCDRMTTLLKRYRHFTKEFVMSCACIRSSQESMEYGSLYNELEHDFKLIFTEVGRYEETAKVLAKKSAQQQLHQRQILNESPQLLINHHGSSQSDVQQQQAQIRFNNLNSTNSKFLSFWDFRCV